MTAPVNEELLTLINEIKSSKYDKDQSIMLLGDLLSNVINNNVPLDQRWGMGLTIGAYTKKVRSGVPKKEASGFFGNWAKHAEENVKGDDFDPIEVNDSGC